jgi:hypothetical protein
MTMTADSELEEFFSREIKSVVADPERFRMKLGIGLKAFKYLSNAKNLGAFMNVATGGSAAAGVAFAGWTASLGTLGQLGLAFGLMSTPVGWFAAAGAGGAAACYIVGKLYRKARDSAITEVPNFINSPLDVLAVSICDLVTPVLLKVAHADSNFCGHERDVMRSYFVGEWGICPDYVEGLLDYDLARLDGFHWEDLDVVLLEMEQSGDLKYEVMADELIRIANEVSWADGQQTPSEVENINQLIAALGR